MLYQKLYADFPATRKMMLKSYRHTHGLQLSSQPCPFRVAKNTFELDLLSLVCQTTFDQAAYAMSLPSKTGSRQCSPGMSHLVLTTLTNSFLCERIIRRDIWGHVDGGRATEPPISLRHGTTTTPRRLGRGGLGIRLRLKFQQRSIRSHPACTSSGATTKEAFYQIHGENY